MEDQYVDSGDRDVKPNAVTFNSVIHAWANAEGPGSGVRAERLLDRMIELSEAGDGDVSPTAYTFSSVIDAHAKSTRKDCGERAEEILGRLSELYLETGKKVLRPNAVTYSAVLNAWAKSEKGLTPPRAEALLRQMSAAMGGTMGSRGELAASNKAFDLAVRELDQSTDEDTVARIELMRQRNILRSIRP